MQTGFTLHNLFWAFTDTNAMWAPMTWLSLMLDHWLFGLNPLGYHLTNLLLHIGNALLLYWFLRRAAGSGWRAALVTALFALHPLRVESVAWISERKDVLSVFFGLAALNAYAAYARVSDDDLRQLPSLRKPWKLVRLYGLMLLLLILSLWSKPMLVTLPFLFLLLDFWPLQRMKRSVPQTHQAGHHAPSPTARFILLILEKIPLAAVAVIFSFITYNAQAYTGAVRNLASYALPSRVANAVVSYARYLGKLFWFKNLAVLYPYPGHWPAWQVAGAASLLLLITALVLWQLRRRPYLAMGWFWFVGTLVPVIGIVQVGDQSMADRYTYFPAIGLCIMAVYAIPSRWVAADIGQRRVTAAALAVLMVMSYFTYIQVSYWENSTALFTHAIAVTNGNFTAHDYLGTELAASGNPNEPNNMSMAIAGAGKHFRAALRINPNDAVAHYGLAGTLMTQGEFAKAAAELRLALQGQPQNADAHLALGYALVNLGQIDAAIGEYQQALRLHPTRPEVAQESLGAAYLLGGDPTRAIDQARKALAINPNVTGAHSLLGQALATLGRFDEALDELAKAQAQRPNDPNIRGLIEKVREAQQRQKKS